MRPILIIAAVILMSGLAALAIHRLNTIHHKVPSEQAFEKASNDQSTAYQGQELIQIPDGSFKQLFLDSFAYLKSLILPGIIGLLLLSILGTTNFFKALEEHLKW